MTDQPNAGAVIYAKDIARVSAFYEAVTDLNVTHTEKGHIVLECAGFQLVVVAMREDIAESIEITNPPERRTDTALKLVLPVTSLSHAREAATRLGGELNPPKREWSFQGHRVCDGHDPEGNVVQFSEVAPK